jgi:predicted PurR-regulated permease PerM
MNINNLIRALVVFFAIWLIWMLRSITVPLLGAYLFMLILQPLNKKLSKKIPQSLSAIVCVLLLLFTPLLCFVPAAFDFQNLLSQVPVDNLQDFSGQLKSQFAEWEKALPAWLSQHTSLNEIQPEVYVESLSNQFSIALSGVVGFFGGVFGIVSGLLLLPIFLYFLLQGGPWLTRIRREMPVSWHASFDRILPQIESISTNYLVARVKVAFVKMMLAFIALLLLNFPGSYAIAFSVGVLSLLPVLGPLIGLFLLGLVGFVDGGYTGGGAGGLLTAILIYGVLEVVEGYVLIPRFVGTGLGLSDFAVILTILCGGALLGILGLVLAVPIVAVSRVLYAEFVRPVMKTEKL